MNAEALANFRKFGACIKPGKTELWWIKSKRLRTGIVISADVVKNTLVVGTPEGNITLSAMDSILMAAVPKSIRKQLKQEK